MSSFAHVCRVWSHNKSLEDHHLMRKCLQCPQHSNRQLHLGSSGRIYVPWMYHFQQPLSGHKTRQENWQGSNSDGWPRGCGTTLCWPWKPRWTFIKPACSELCFMAVKLGLRTPAKSVDTTRSTCAAFDRFRASPGKTISQQGHLNEIRNVCIPVCSAIPKALALAWSSQTTEGWKNP